MSGVYANYCKWNSSTSGTGSFTVGTAATADAAGSHDVPENCAVISGNTYRYYAQSADGSQTEWGRGVYNSTTHTLSRATVVVNTDGTTTPLNFTTNPIIDLFPAPIKFVESAAFDRFPSGTLMLFQQTSAPPGWTKQTTHNDKALRVVSGTASSGGTNSFSSMFASRTSDAVTLSIGQIPSHQHSDNEGNSSAGGTLLAFAAFGTDYSIYSLPTATGANGGSGSHAHTYDMRVQYVDLIIAAKN